MKNFAQVAFWVLAGLTAANTIAVVIAEYAIGKQELP